MSNIATKLTYLNGTKQAIKQAINEDFEVIDDNTTFREYADEISSNNAKYKDLIPKETKNATNTLDISNSSGLDKALVTQYGNTYQANAILPSGYTQVDYIESTSYTHNSNYIDLNFKPNNNTAIEVKMEYTTTNAQYGRIFGSSDLFRTETAASSDTRTTFYWNNGSIITEYAGANVIKIYKLDKNKVYIDETLTHTFTTATFQDTYNLRLFSASTGNRDSLIRIYYAKLWDNGTLIRDMIPCIQTSSNKVGMYDLANNVFYENGGNVAFVYGSTVNIPNPDYSQEIVNISGKSTLKDVGKNLFDKDNTNIINAYINISVLKVVGESGGSFYIPCEPNTTYTVSKTELFGNDRFCVFDTYRIPTAGDTILSYVGKPTRGNSDTSLTITTNATATYLGIFIKAGETSPAKTFQEIADTIQVEKNSTATTYEPYQEQSFDLDLPFELCKIDTYKDRIYPLNGKWYLEKKINKVVLNGTENWNYQSEHHRFIMNLSPRPVNGVMCYATTYIRGQTSSAGSNNTISVASGTGYSQLLIHDERFTTKNDYNNWLSNNNVEVYYPLETPTTEEITESNYPTLYNQLNNIKLYEGVNHLTFTNESGLDVEFDIEYYKDWKLD